MHSFFSEVLYDSHRPLIKSFMKTIAKIDKYRIQANRLQKSVRQLFKEKMSGSEIDQIITRFKQMGELNSENPEYSHKQLNAFQISKYLDLIAFEAGHCNWLTMSRLLKEQDQKEGLTNEEDIELYKFGTSEFNLNVWCPSYEEARAYLDSHRGFYLLHYKGNCFLAQAPHILNIGLNPNDPDWDEIDRDWVKPKNPEAKKRLQQKLRQASAQIEN